MSHNVSLIGSVSFAWLHEHGGLRFDEPFFMDPRCRLERENAANALATGRFSDDPIYCFEGSLVQTEGRRQPVALVGGIQPNLILGAAVGAQFVFYGDKDADITPTPLAGITDLARLWQTDWANARPIDLFLRQVREMRASFGSQLAVIPPFFWDTTGRATVHGVLTTAQKLVGESIFMDMMDRPAFVRELFDWIADAYLRLIRLFADAADMKITALHVGECSACMLGPDQFAEFVLPPTNKLIDGLCVAPGVSAQPGTANCRVHPGPTDRPPAGVGVRLHSCGLSDHLLDVLPDLHGLTCLNVGSGTSIAGIRERSPLTRCGSQGEPDSQSESKATCHGLGGIRIDVIPETHLLTAAPPSDVDVWVRRSLDENTGGPLEFQFHLDAGQPEENCLQIARTLRAMGIPCPRQSVF